MNKAKTIRCYDYVNHPYDVVRDSLSAGGSGVFHDATKAATSHAQTLTSELRVNIGGIEIGTDISISMKKIEDRPKESGSSPLTRFQLAWGATKMPGLFPFMNAELLVYPLTAKETQLDFSGHYEPPLGVLGEALDAVVGHRIAEASVHRFIQNVAAYLRSELSNPA
jgi:hypothetical protein